MGKVPIDQQGNYGGKEQREHDHDRNQIAQNFDGFGHFSIGGSQQIKSQDHKQKPHMVSAVDKSDHRPAPVPVGKIGVQGIERRPEQKRGEDAQDIFPVQRADLKRLSRIQHQRAAEHQEHGNRPLGKTVVKVEDDPILGHNRNVVPILGGNVDHNHRSRGHYPQIIQIGKTNRFSFRGCFHENPSS